MEKLVVAPGASVDGVVPDANLNSGHVDVMAVIVVLAVPVFLTVIDLVSELNPT
jgi:hypothetical protein